MSKIFEADSAKFHKLGPWRATSIVENTVNVSNC